MSNRQLAIIDIDGVLADSTKRFEQATIDGKINWKMAFDPAAVSLDTPIDGVGQGLDRLIEQGYTVILLTSRPESMREATVAWLAKHGIGHRYEGLEMKPTSAQFVKTTKWKAQRVAELAQEHDTNTLIIIDDEEANLAAITEQLTTNGYAFTTYGSLQTCMQIWSAS